MIAVFTAWTYPKTHQTWNIQYVTPAEKCHNLLLSLISTTRWRYNQGEWVLPNNPHVFCRTFKNPISTCSLNCAKMCDIGRAHFRQPFFPCRKPTFSNSYQALSPICNFAHSIYGLAWQKVITRILIFQTILKLLNNFQSILLKTQSVAYLLGLSEWHETQVTLRLCENHICISLEIWKFSVSTEYNQTHKRIVK